MNTLIRAIEVWVPDQDGYLLEHGDGLYGGAREFEAVSRALVFGRGEGLPGRVWDDGKPVLLAQLDGSGFRRAKAAKKAGLLAAVALPWHVAGALQAVVVFFFGFDAAAGAAVDLWKRGLGVDEWVAGYYGTGATTAPPPAVDAEPGLMLECCGSDGTGYVLTLASPPTLPVAEGIDTWTLAADGRSVRSAGRRSPSRIDEAMVAEAFACALPRVSLDGTIVLPVLRGETVVEAVALRVASTVAATA